MMKKAFAIILSLVMILNLSVIMASASDSEAVSDTEDILIVYGYHMTAAEMYEYYQADWEEKMTILDSAYAQSKEELLTDIATLCEYEILRDTSVNRIYLRVPKSKVDEIAALSKVKRLVEQTVATSKLNENARELIASANPKKVVNVWIWTDREDVVAMRDYLNIGKKEFNIYFESFDEDGVSEWMKACRAYYKPHTLSLMKEITDKTDAVCTPYGYESTDNGKTWTPLDLLWMFSIDIPVGQLEILDTIDGIGFVTYAPKEESNKLSAELIEAVAADPEKIISAAAERVVDPLTVEDMPSYREGDRDSLDIARRELAELNRQLNEAFIAELAEYAEFEVKLNTNTNIVVLSLRAGDVYALAKCGSVDSLDFVSDEKAVNHAGADKLIGDTDGDAFVTILDATAIQRELAEIGSAYFDADAADYDADGDMTVLDATAIRRAIAEL